MNLSLIAHDNVFSSASARTQGLNTHALARLEREGQCLRLARGWYAVTDPAKKPDLVEQHRLRAIAFGREFAHRAAVSHHSGVILAGLPTHSVPLGTVFLTDVRPSPGTPGSARPPRVTRRSVTVKRAGLRIHRAVSDLRLPPRAAGVDGQVPLIALPLGTCIVQCGLLGGPEAALVPADAALRGGLVTAAELTCAVAGLSGRPGIGPVRSAIQHADGRHESPGESRTGHVLRALGYRLDPQFEVVAEGRRYRADFRITGTRVLVEFDGAVKYASGDRRALFAEKAREDALRRAGWVVVRIIWSELDDVALIRKRVGDAVRAASVPAL